MLCLPKICIVRYVLLLIVYIYYNTFSNKHTSETTLFNYITIPTLTNKIRYWYDIYNT